jgi:tetratricopeptide (TPR) repeat protein
MVVSALALFRHSLVFRAAMVNLIGCLCLVSLPSALAEYENPAFDRGRARMSHGDWDGAVESFGESIGFSSESPDPYFLRGQCFLHMKNYDLAITDFGHALKIAPDKSEIYLWRGAAYSKTNQDEGAIKDYEQAIRLDPKLAKNYFDGEKRAANPQPEAAAVGRPDFKARPELFARGGTRFTQQGKDEHSIGIYKAAMSRVYPNGYPGPENTASANVGVSGVSTGAESLGAVNASGGATSVSAGAASANGGAASDDRAENRPDKKGRKRIAKNEEDRQAKQDEVRHERAKLHVEQYSEAIRQEPSNAANYFHRGKAHQVLKNYDQAIADFSDAIRLSPQNSQFYIARASVYMLMGKPVMAEADVKSAHSVDPTLPHKVNLELE